MAVCEFSRAAVPSLFGTRSWFHGRQFSHGLGVCGGAEMEWDGFRMIQVQYIYCAFISDLILMMTGGTGLWLRDWGPLL